MLNIRNIVNSGRRVPSAIKINNWQTGSIGEEDVSQQGSHFFVTYIKKTWLLILVIAMPTINQSALAESRQTIQNLERVESLHFDSFQVADDAVLPRSQKIYINVEASFARDWVRQFKATTSRIYRKQTTQTYGQILHKHMKQSLESSGWEVLEQPKEGVIDVNIKLKDIYINGPEKLDRVHVLVSEIGQSTLEIVINGADGRPILKIEDYRKAGGLTDFFIETDRSVNFHWFNKLMKGWARDLTLYIDTMQINDIAKTKIEGFDSSI